MRDVPAQLGGPDALRLPGAWGSVRIRNIVLLAGAVGGTSLAARVGRSVLDLPVAGSLTLLDVWKERFREQSQGPWEGATAPEVLILAGETDPLPRLPEVGGADGAGRVHRLRAVRDPRGYRGTAGVLRDLCEGFADDDHVLVGTASQCPDAALLAQLILEADPLCGVTVSADARGAPSGLLIVRCGALRDVTPVGYVDLKEQALPKIARISGARVVTVRGGVSPAIRDLQTYLAAVRSWHRSGSLRGAAPGSAFEERWRPTFAVVEPGAQVASDARIHDSVVLAGGRVESGAQVIRSVVGPGGIVRRRARALDQLVLGGDLPKAEAAQAAQGAQR